MSAGKRRGAMVAEVSMDDEDVSADIPRIGYDPPEVPPITVERFSMKALLGMPAWMVQDIINEVEPDLQAILRYRQVLLDALQIRLDIEAAGKRNTER